MGLWGRNKVNVGGEKRSRGVPRRVFGRKKRLLGKGKIKARKTGVWGRLKGEADPIRGKKVETPLFEKSKSRGPSPLSLGLEGLSGEGGGFLLNCGNGGREGAGVA